jgi:hypothetical protein
VVELLTGVIPDRAMFRKPVLKAALAPYFQIVQGKSNPRVNLHNLTTQPFEWET